MKEYHIHYPRWFILLQLGFFVIFATVWTYITIQKEIYLFTLIGFALFIFAGALLIYALKTGRYPMSFREK
ncbi:hypothetical protein KY338_04135 [Candidatus Woesearchaeota archaeon]|nr:hypothetical protein [Candidatus Woesearchaeota archaeon]MBW3005503.1 hypothetical protein [Candidatus Woesearchaeota archaeon]